MLDIIGWTLCGGVSGGCIYFMVADIYKLNRGIIRVIPPMTRYSFLNYGFLAGSLLGFYRGYVGEPIIDFLVKIGY